LWRSSWSWASTSFNFNSISCLFLHSLANSWFKAVDFPLVGLIPTPRLQQYLVRFPQLNGKLLEPSTIQFPVALFLFFFETLKLAVFPLPFFFCICTFFYI
jgi:hypothetical protein